MTGLHVERRGRGQSPLVMIHGWAMHGGILSPLSEALHDHCDIYVVDLPGHGFSRDSTVPLEPAACVDAIAAVTPPAVWLGWSLGGLVATTAALQRAGQVKGLVAISSTPRFVRDADWPYGNDAAMVRKLASDLQADYKTTVDRFIALEAMGSADPRGETRRLLAEAYARGEPDPRVLLEGLHLLESADLRPQLPALAVPSVWIAGRRDRIVHPQAMSAAAQLAGGPFIELPHAGHAPFIGHADALRDVLVPFIEALP